MVNLLLVTSEDICYAFDYIETLIILAVINVMLCGVQIVAAGGRRVQWRSQVGFPNGKSLKVEEKA